MQPNAAGFPALPSLQSRATGLALSLAIALALALALLELELLHLGANVLLDGG